MSNGLPSSMRRFTRRSVPLVVHIVVGGAVNEKKTTLQSLGKMNGRADLIPFGIVFRQAHVAFLVDGVVELLIGHRRHRDTDLEDLRVAEHAIQGVRATATPPPDSDALGIDKGVLAGERPDCSRLISGGVFANGAVDDLSPGRSFGRWRTAVVEADHYEARVGHGPMKQHPVASPAIHHGGSRRLSIDEDEQWVAPTRIEIARLQHPGIERDACLDLSLEELHRWHDDVAKSARQLGVVFQDAHGLMPGKAHQVDHGWDIEAGIGMKSVGPVG